MEVLEIRALRRRALCSCLLALACAPSQPITRASPEPSPRFELSCTAEFSGPGARPVSPTTVANWYIKDGRLVYILFLRGMPGWYNKRTKWDIRNDSTGVVQDFDVGGFRYGLALNESTRTLSVLGSHANLRQGNVVLMDRAADTGVIRRSEFLDFCWSSPPDVVAEVLGRSRETEKFVSSAPGA